MLPMLVTSRDVKNRVAEQTEITEGDVKMNCPCSKYYSGECNNPGVTEWMSDEGIKQKRNCEEEE